MTQEDIEKIELLNNCFLSETGKHELVKLGVFKDLVISLTKEDIEVIITNQILFSPIFSPACQTTIKRMIPECSKIISIDINTMKQFTSQESVAIILHEIGHAMNPEKKGEEGEFIADDYAKDRNFSIHIISSLEKGKKLWKEEFDKPITAKRIERLKEIK